MPQEIRPEGRIGRNMGVLGSGATQTIAVPFQMLSMYIA